MPDPGPKINQAREMFLSGRHEQAKALLTRLAQQFPGHPDVSTGLALVLTQLGQYEQALFHARRAAEAKPDHPNLLINLGNALAMTGKDDEALEVFLEAAAAMPERAEPRLGLSNIHRNRGELSKAAEHMREGLRHTPYDQNMSAILGSVLLNLGRSEESVEVCRAALKHHPGHIQVASMLASATNYAPGITPEESLEAHRLCAAAIQASAPPLRPARPKPTSPRPPRVGLVSHDLRQHSLAYFLEPILSGRGAMEIHCYHTSPDEDAMSARLKPLASSWRNVAKLSDTALAERIHADAIDVLIDTAGLTQGHRLGVLAARPAPVQCTFLGYPNTTGIRAIDCRLVDSITDPPGSERWATETLIRMDPCFLCYTPPPDSPEPAAPPSAAAGRITFGSFNAATKINGPLIALWARVLAAVPGSRMILKAFDFKDAPLREDLAARFAAAGVDPSRVEVLPPAGGVADHLALYSRVDIALDTFPYHGTTTTLEALHMGLPVVTLEGKVHASRVGVSLLRNVGLEELVAADEPRYVALAAGLAGDPARLATLRSGLRGRLAASPLCDRAGYARRFSQAVQTMWDRWCRS